MVDQNVLIEALRARAVLAARVEKFEAARVARSKAVEVRAPYAVCVSWTPNRPVRVDVPCVPLSMEYSGTHVPDNTLFHQVKDPVRNEVLAYSHEYADWVAPPKDDRAKGLGVTVNPGRASEMTTLDKGKPLPAPRPCLSVQRIAPLKLWRAKRCAPNAGRGAEMLVTDRPVAQPRPAFTRRDRGYYARNRSRLYVLAVQTLRMAILRDVPTYNAKGVRVWGELVVHARRHLLDAHTENQKCPEGVTHTQLISEHLP